MSETPRTDAFEALVDRPINWWDFARQLERENAALRELTSTLGAPNHINIPVEKWHELREDKERLEWLESLHSLWEGTEKTGPVFLTRAAIDAARKEAQP